MKRPQEAVALALVHCVRTSTDLAVPPFGSVQFQGFVGPYTYSVSSCTSNLWSTRAATVDQLAIAETSSHRRLDQLIQISYLRSAGVNGAVNLLGTTSLTVQELS
ncbi:unnamed protein product, partial [Penicillium salamii]